MTRGGSYSHGNSFANGSESAGNAGSPYAWLSGYQAPAPVTIYDFMEGRLDGFGLS